MSLSGINFCAVFLITSLGKEHINWKANSKYILTIPKEYFVIFLMIIILQDRFTTFVIIDKTKVLEVFFIVFEKRSSMFSIFVCLSFSVVDMFI